MSIYVYTQWMIIDDNWRSGMNLDEYGKSFVVSLWVSLKSIELLGWNLWLIHVETGQIPNTSENNGDWEYPLLFNSLPWKMDHLWIIDIDMLRNILIDDVPAIFWWDSITILNYKRICLVKIHSWCIDAWIIRYIFRYIWVVSVCLWQ